MASPQGWIFDRDAVVEYLATERDELQKKLREWELERQRLSLRNAESGQAKVQQVREQWKSNETALCVPSKGSTVKAGVKRTFGEVSKNNSSSSSFWVSGNSESVASEIPQEKPDTTPKCPMSGAKLRFKDLVPVHFEITTNEEAAKGVYSCALTKRSLTHQQAVLLKPSGAVLLETVFKQSVEPDMVCPVSGLKLVEGDIIKLQRGGTGFSSHSAVEVKVSRHLPTRAQEGGTRMLSL